MDLKILDCTLRDGGYINDWKFGFNSARSIIKLISFSNIEMIEVGFLRDVEAYNPDVTVCSSIEDLNKLLPEDASDTIYSAMIMQSNYDINKLTAYCGKGIEMIRITSHDYDIEEGMDYARKVKKKGYKISINPINIMGYSDERILRIVEEVNTIQPYQFSIVDTFGSMKRKDLDRIVSIVDNNLDASIRLDLHLHENMSLSCSLAQAFIDKHLKRPIAIDCSLMGMGRIPGNLPTELIADYSNDTIGKAYDIDYLMDAIQDYIAPIKGETLWGYTPAYFLSARYNLHRNYAEFYLKKGDLTNKGINQLMSRFDDSKKTVFDEIYANNLYEEYKNQQIDDKRDWENLKECFNDKTVFLIAPGKTVITYKDIIEDYLKKVNVISVGINFAPPDIKVDYVFFSNIKRYLLMNNTDVKKIITSNLVGCNAEFKINYSRVSGAFEQGCNSFIMCLKMLKELGVTKILVAGADGYVETKDNYYSIDMRSTLSQGSNYNRAVIDAIRALNLKVTYITPSEYDIRKSEK